MRMWVGVWLGGVRVGLCAYGWVGVVSCEGGWGCKGQRLGA